MRQIIIEIEPNDETRERQKTIFQHIYSYEVLEMLKMDYGEGIYVDLIECQLREDVSIHDLEFIGNMEILSIVGSEGNKHTCIVKGYESYSELDLDLIYTTPSMISEDRIIVSFIGAQQNLMRFVEMVRSHVGEIKNISFKKAAYQKQDILTILTGKQREVLAAAYEHGYYDIPRRISSERLSEKVKISKPTLIEHLRKAERRILAEIMAGHS